MNFTTAEITAWVGALLWPFLRIGAMLVAAPLFGAGMVTVRIRLAFAFLLASLVVVIVGGMGSIPGAAIGAVIVGLAEQLGFVYLPTYSVVITFLILALVLAFRPQGLLGRSR